MVDHSRRHVGREPGGRRAAVQDSGGPAPPRPGRQSGADGPDQPGARPGACRSRRSLMLTDQAYYEMQNHIGIVVGIIVRMELEEFVERINQAEAVGPVLDPTLYLRAGDALQQIKQVASALLEVKQTALRLAAKQKGQ